MKNPARRESGAGFLVSVCDLRLQPEAPHLRRGSSTSGRPDGAAVGDRAEANRALNSIVSLLAGCRRDLAIAA